MLIKLVEDIERGMEQDIRNGAKILFVEYNPEIPLLEICPI